MKSWISIAALFFCMYASTQAQTDTVVVRSTELHDVRQSIKYFVDESSELDLGAIKVKENQGEFISYGDNVPNFTGQHGTIWFHFTIQNLIEDDVVLTLPLFFIDRLKVYITSPDGKTITKETGSLYLTSSRDFVVSDYVVHLVEKGDSRTVEVFGSVQSDTLPPMILLIQVGSERAVLAHVRMSEFISISVLGMFIVMLFYNFCLYLVIRDGLYLYYCFYIVISILTIGWFNGYNNEWLWPGFPQINSNPWLYGVFSLAQLVFGDKLLPIRTMLPKIHWIIYFIYAICVLVIFNMFLMTPAGAQPLVTILGMALPVYFLLTSVILCIRGIRMAYIFLLGWLPILATTIILNLGMIRGIFEYNEFYDTHAVELALAWEVVIFSLALGYRFNVMRTEKMEMQAENLRIINEQKTTLRKLVFEQTEEILSQNDLLLKNQTEIKLQNERLETQNKAYERLKEMILRQNQELEHSVQRRTLQLAQSNEELKKYVQQLEQFSFIAAHNLRAPVARILGLANIINLDSPSNPENTNILKKIVTSAKDLDTIIHDLGSILDAQKNKNDKYEPIDVHDLTEKILNRFRTDIDKEGVIIEKLISAPIIWAIPAYLDSIFSNLISNSIKYCADNRTPIILIATEESPTYFSLIVHDNGIGFDSKQFQRKLFEPFQRFHTHKDGKGLGMFLVRAQVMAMEGTISLVSEPDIGTHIVITIPKHESNSTKQEDVSHVA